MRGKILRDSIAGNGWRWLANGALAGMREISAVVTRPATPEKGYARR